MNRTRQILKKSAAAVLCASLILSGSSTAFAAAAARCGDLPAGVPIRKQKRLPLTNSQTAFRKLGILISKITRNLPPEVKAT